MQAEEKLQLEPFKLFFVGALFEQPGLLRFVCQMNHQVIAAKHVLRVPLVRLDHLGIECGKHLVHVRDSDVFTRDVISTWIWYKREKEVDAIRLRPHPYEFHLYYDI